MEDSDYPRTSISITWEGFHCGLKPRVNRALTTVQEYFQAVREKQVTTDFHLDHLAVGLSPPRNVGSLAATCSMLTIWRPCGLVAQQLILDRWSCL